jgi:hypothetical protein
MAIAICRGLSAVTPYQITQQNLFVEGPKSSKGTLRPNFQAFTRHMIFFLKTMSSQDTGIQCKEILV